MNILGISAFYHDSAAALVVNGKIVSASQEERFTRIKHDSSFPSMAINSVLEQANLSINEIDYVVFYDKPILKFERLLETYIHSSPKGFASFKTAIPIWIKDKLFLKNFIFKEIKSKNSHFKESQIMFSEHHFSHAASAYYPSPFDEAIILTLDGVGEWATSTISIGKENKLNIIKEQHFPHSLGLLYSAFTYYAGFRVNSGEYKLMGLAPYGKPIYKDLILQNIIDLKDDGSFLIDQSYFKYSTGLTMISKKFENLFGRPARKSDEDEIQEFHMDIAASIQALTEEIVILITKNIRKKYKIKNLCMAGGVALNCVANGKLIRENIFENIWIQPAAGDAGGAIGAALAFWFDELGNKRNADDNDGMNGSFLGNSYSPSQIKLALEEAGAEFFEYSEEVVIQKTAESLSKNMAVGWFQGRMEFGPRALGNRSILGNPLSKDTQKNLNLKIKFRESFRPFAPAILREDLQDWFSLDSDSPYMLLVAKIKDSLIIENEEIVHGQLNKLNFKRSKIPAVTHVDYSARIQTVHKETNNKFHKLISEFKKITGCPILVNTSFNVRSEPIVMSPKDAFKCFMGNNLDILVIDNFILKKEDQNSKLLSEYYNDLELD